MGLVVSYKEGARRMMSAVPRRHTNVKMYRNILSRTIATYFQSSSTYDSNETLAIIELEITSKSNNIILDFLLNINKWLSGLISMYLFDETSSFRNF